MSTEVTFRRAGEADSYAVFEVFERAFGDLTRRLGSTQRATAGDPEAMARMWKARRPIYEHLARTADQFWVAEKGGRVVGFSRSILRDGLQELTELFVDPDVQSSGLGRELISRALLQTDASLRLIIATSDMRAQALYLKNGVYPRFPLYYFGREPQRVDVGTDLTIRRAEATPEVLADLDRIDAEIIGHRRSKDHIWLSANRELYLYQRHGNVVGYGYLGPANGPFALLDERDYPGVLSHAESQAAEAGYPEFGLEVPMVNQQAVDYLVGRGFKLSSFMATFMSNKPFGSFERYLIIAPPFLL